MQQNENKFYEQNGVEYDALGHSNRETRERYRVAVKEPGTRYVKSLTGIPVDRATKLSPKDCEYQHLLMTYTQRKSRNRQRFVFQMDVWRKSKKTKLIRTNTFSVQGRTTMKELRTAAQKKQEKRQCLTDITTNKTRQQEVVSQSKSTPSH